MFMIFFVAMEKKQKNWMEERQKKLDANVTCFQLRDPSINCIQCCL